MAENKVALSTESPWSDKHRPTLLKDIVGQDTARLKVAGFFKSGKIPQSILFQGQSGVSKTTFIQYIANKLSPTGFDVHKSNASEATGIDKMRETIAAAQMKPMHGPFKVFCMDEAHGLTKQSGSAALEFIEKPPAHVVVLMATDQPERMLKTLRDRAVKISLKPLTPDVIKTILLRVAALEKVFQPPEQFAPIFNTLSHMSMGSARPAIDALYQLSLIQAMRPIKKDDIESEISRILEFDYKDAPRFIAKWYSGDPTAMQILKGVGDPAAFVSLLCSIHYYLLQKLTRMEPGFDFLGNAAIKAMKDPKVLKFELVHQNFQVLLDLRQAILNPVGRDPQHLFLNGCLNLKDKL